jgi:VanZ family protein
MLLIFCLSNQPADESSNLSDSLIMRIFKAVGIKIPVKVVRKAAHAIEFGSLAFLFSSFFTALKKENWHLISLALTFFYACTDEVHQIFIPGRAGRISDVLIDTTGALFGIAVYFIIVKILEQVRRKKDVSNTSV